MTSLDGETVLVTGASSGLGREMVGAFADAGANVVLVARRENALQEVARTMTGQAETLVISTDVASEDEVEEAVDRATDVFGGIGTLVNNAGVGLVRMSGRGKPVGEITTEEWNEILGVNLRGAFFFSRAVLPHLARRGGGNVVNVTSTFATEPKAGWAPYVSSKFGLLGLTKTMALDYADDGINVNSLHPGGKVSTAFWRHREVDDDSLDPDVMNEAAVRLAAQDPHGVTGEHRDAAGWEELLG